MGQPHTSPLTTEAELQAELEEACTLSSPTGNAQAIENMARWYASKLRPFGFEVHFQATPHGPILAAHLPGSQGPYLLVAGHMDTVLPARPVCRREHRLYGSGAVDMKAGLITLFGALRLVIQRGKRIPANLAVVLVPDEESSAQASRQAMAHWGALAEAVLVMEPGSQIEGCETLVLGRKGLTEFQAKFTGIAAHSGLAFHEGRSALTAASHFAVAAEKLSQGETTVNLARLVAGDRRFVADLATESHILSTSERRNVIPDAALLEGEFRFATLEAGTKLATQLAKLARQIGKERGVAVTFALGQRVMPVATEAGLPLAHCVQELAQEVELQLRLELCRGGISLANFLQRQDLPVLDGLGPVGGGMHTEEEYVDLTSLVKRTQLLAKLLTAYPHCRATAAPTAGAKR